MVWNSPEQAPEEPSFGIELSHVTLAERPEILTKNTQAVPNAIDLPQQRSPDLTGQFAVRCYET
jgi:hypothetical protein